MLKEKRPYNRPKTTYDKPRNPAGCPKRAHKTEPFYIRLDEAVTTVLKANKEVVKQALITLAESLIKDKGDVLN